MNYAYASRTGNVQSIIDALGLTGTFIQTGDETIEGDYILFTYTDGFGDIPFEVDAFLGNNAAGLKGVVVSGSHAYDPAFCGAGDKIAEQYGVPVLYKVEDGGTSEDLDNIKAELAKF